MFKIRWNIRAKLFTAIASFLVVFIFFVIWGLSIFRQTETSLYQEERMLTQGLVYMMEIISDMSEIKARVLTLILFDSADPRSKALTDEINLEVKNLESKVLKYYNFEIGAESESEKVKTEQVLGEIENFGIIINGLVERKNNGAGSEELLVELDLKNRETFIPLLNFLNEHKNEHVGSLSAFSASTSQASSKMIWIIYTAVILMLLLPIVLNFLIYYQIIRPIEKLHLAVDKVAAGDYGHRVSLKRSDEIGSLSVAFNEMAGQIEKNKQNVEKKIVERTADLEKLNSFMVGREIKMMELKKELALKEKK